MRRPKPARRASSIACAIALAMAAGAALAGCAPLDLAGQTSATPSSLQPQSEAAANIAELWWIMLGLGTAVWALVTALLLTALFRRRRADEQGQPSPDIERRQTRVSNALIVGGGIVLPVAVLAVVFALTVRSMRAIAVAAPPEALVVEVTGHQYWWSVRYPDQPMTTVFTTANELRIPVGQPVTVRLSSADVIHSFWVPQLHGKTDLIPGRVNTLVIQADSPGDYLGICAEYCGIQHAKMGFVVVAEPPEQFEAWLRGQQQPAAEPTDPLAMAGKQVFLASQCALCHAIAGTPAVADVGPDLTHLASRRTIAAAALPNTRGHLAGWLADPQHIKPGNEMPPSELSSEDLQALLAYLEGLK